jgi:cleavage and polyadenylation specificity factor subunit 5
LPGLAATTAWSWSSTINEVNAADIKYSQRTLTNTTEDRRNSIYVITRKTYWQRRKTTTLRPARDSYTTRDTATMAAVPASETKSSLPAKDILPFDARQSEAIRLFPLSNYTFGTKETQPEEDPSVKDRLRRLEEYYDNHGMRRTGEGILVCHEHNHPHILMLQIANAFFKL